MYRYNIYIIYSIAITLYQENGSKEYFTTTF